MNKNIINKYIKLLLIIINNVDPINKYICRLIIYTYKYCLKIILLDLWSSDAVYRDFMEINGKTFKNQKRFNKWIALEVFNKAYNSLFKL
jgi:hypothetical protein